MRRLYILSLLVLSSQLCTAVADTKSDFREAYQRYQQDISIADTTAALKAADDFSTARSELAPLVSLAGGSSTSMDGADAANLPVP